MEEKKIRLKDIAEIVGTSTISVHRALHGKPGISDELRERILEEVKRQNYSINEVASTLRRATYHIGILLPKAENEERFFFQSIWSSIKEKLPEYEKQKVQFHIFESDLGLLGMAEALKNLYDSTEELHALLTVCEDEESAEWLRRFERRGTRIAVISNTVTLEEDWHYIMASKSANGELAAEFLSHILSQKKGKVLLLSGDEAVYSNYRFSEGFRKILTERCPKCKIEEVKGFSLKNIGIDLKQQIQEEKYVGIVASNARLTYQICRMLQENKLSGKMSVVGLDVFEELREFLEDETLTCTIYQSAKEQGILALECLYRELTERENGEKERYQEMPCCLVMRQNFKYYI